MSRSLGICFFLLLCATHMLAIEASVAHSLFYVPDPVHQNKLIPSVEANWQVDPRSVHYTTNAEKMIIARIRTDIFFTNEKGLVKEDHFILQTVPRSSVEELMAHSIIDLRRYTITPGFTRMRFVLTDLADSTHPFTFRDSFNVAAPSDLPFYSDLQLLDTTLPSTANTVFKKNDRQQLPSCMNFLDDNRRVLHYYTEIYQADNVAKESLPLTQKVFISKKEDEAPLNKFLFKEDTVYPHHIVAVSGDLSLAYLPSGNYYLNVVLENSMHLRIASSSLFIQRLNYQPIPVDTIRKKATIVDTGMENINVLNLEKTFLSKYTPLQTRAILKMLLPVTDAVGTQAINGFLKKPDDLYTRYFIYNFFVSINKKEPGAAWKEYSKKIKEVNGLFSEGGTPGYETDRGFMYIRYGKPTEIITVENENGALPYEVWQYNVLTQMNHKDIDNRVFLFYRPSQYTTGFKLLHSSVPGEIRTPTWRTYLYPAGIGEFNNNSRAEQYIGNK